MNNLDIQSANKFSSLGASSAVLKKPSVFGRIKSTSTQTATIATRIEDLTGRLFGGPGEATGKGGIDAPVAAVQQAFDDLNGIDDDLARIVRAIAMLEELLP